MSKKNKSGEAKVETTEIKFSLKENIQMFFQGIFNFFLVNRFAMACLIAMIIVTVIFACKYPWGT